MHLILLDALSLSGELGHREFLNGFYLVPPIAEKEEELVDEQLVHRCLIIWVIHLLLLLEVTFDGPDVFLEVFPLLLLALKEWPILLDPLPDQLITHCLVNEVKSVQDHVLIQRQVGTLALLFHEGEGVDARSDLFNGEKVPLQDDDRRGHQLDVTYCLSVIQVLKKIDVKGI